MIQKETIYDVGDSSKARKVKLIANYRGRKKSQLGDKIFVSVQVRDPGLVKEIKKGEKRKAIIVRTKERFRRNKNGFCITFKFPNNSVILIDDNNKPIGSRMTCSTVKKIKSLPGLSNYVNQVY